MNYYYIEKKLKEINNMNYYYIEEKLKELNKRFYSLGKKEADMKWRDKIKNVKYDYPKSENQKEHERNIEIIERTVNQIKNQLLQ